MAPHSTTLAWEIPWTEWPGGLQSTGCKDRTGRSAHTRVHRLKAEICTVTPWCPIYPTPIGSTQTALLLS